MNKIGNSFFSREKCWRLLAEMKAPHGVGFSRGCGRFWENVYFRFLASSWSILGKLFSVFRVDLVDFGKKWSWVLASIWSIWEKIGSGTMMGLARFYFNADYWIQWSAEITEFSNQILLKLLHWSDDGSVDLGESFPTSIYLQILASIQPRTGLSKFAKVSQS